jgi:hypothetical protein
MILVPFMKGPSRFAFTGPIMPTVGAFPDLTYLTMCHRVELDTICEWMQLMM